MTNFELDPQNIIVGIRLVLPSLQDRSLLNMLKSFEHVPSCSLSLKQRLLQVAPPLQTAQTLDDLVKMEGEEPKKAQGSAMAMESYGHLDTDSTRQREEMVKS